MSDENLESERLILKPLSFEELSYINNNEFDNIEIIIELEGIFDSVKLAISKKLIKMKNIDKNLHKWYTYWMIINKENEKGIGFIGFKGIPDENSYSEVGYSISASYRKQRFMTEALERLVKWAYGFQYCRGITAQVLKTNVGSNKVLTNCKFKIESSTEQYDSFILKFRH
ncbi:GNAT family N-acetyltransferase [Clostridium thailandense]|uniref:GNAT family N-acetyltransferase n=1 Tax=Clostridium thailandense TaxID=2794346 RepID=UPI0039897897